MLIIDIIKKGFVYFGDKVTGAWVSTFLKSSQLNPIKKFSQKPLIIHQKINLVKKKMGGQRFEPLSVSAHMPGWKGLRKRER